jgi:hypothetical protein
MFFKFESLWVAGGKEGLGLFVQFSDASSEESSSLL